MAAALPFAKAEAVLGGCHGRGGGHDGHTYIRTRCHPLCYDWCGGGVTFFTAAIGLGYATLPDELAVFLWQMGVRPDEWYSGDKNKVR